MNIVKTESQRDSANLILQIGVASAVLVLAFIVVWQVAEKNLDADSFVVGSVFTLVTLLVNFCFPNSIGNAKKDDTINKLADKTPPVTVPKEDLTYGPAGASEQNRIATASNRSSDSGMPGASQPVTSSVEPPDRTPWE